MIAHRKINRPDPPMKDYVEDICENTAKNGLMINLGRIVPPASDHNGAVVAPLNFEVDEFSGIWFVEFGVALNGRFAIFRLDLGQARFRSTTVSDVRHPDGIRKNEAEVKRDQLIEALDQRFGSARVHAAASSIEATLIWKRLWPC
jgi:hypothetical protein